jgi:hypothetical protein
MQFVESKRESILVVVMSGDVPSENLTECQASSFPCGGSYGNS